MSSKYPDIPRIFHIENGPDGKPVNWEDALWLELTDIFSEFIPESHSEWEDIEEKYFIDSAKGIMDEVLYYRESQDLSPADILKDTYRFWLKSLFKIAWTAIYELYTDEKSEWASLSIIEELAELIINKQHDYGSENISAFGVDGLIVRINDKVSRLHNLYSRKHIAKNEEAKDSFSDIMGYCVLALMVMDGYFSLKMKLTKKSKKC